LVFRYLNDGGELNSWGDAKRESEVVWILLALNEVLEEVSEARRWEARLENVAPGALSIPNLKSCADAGIT
jgi:hypothetical protein